MVEVFSVRERVIDHIQATLLAIGPKGSIVAARNRSKPTLVCAGTYTGTCFTLFMVSVVTGGASGVAQVEIQNRLTETVIATKTVTSGVAFDLADGLTLTMTWTGNLQANDVWFVKSGPGTVYPKHAFHHDIVAIIWTNISTYIPDRIPSIVVYDAGESPDETHNSMECPLEIDLFAWCKGETRDFVDMQRTADARQESNALIADIKMALLADGQRNQLAESTSIDFIQNTPASDGSEKAVSQISVTVLYGHDWNDPFVVR
jgi:hypothetical protein